MKSRYFAEVPCHNRARKPVSAGKGEFIDDSLMLILRDLLEAKDDPEIPVWRKFRGLLEGELSWGESDYRGS